MEIFIGKLDFGEYINNLSEIVGNLIEVIRTIDKNN